MRTIQGLIGAVVAVTGCAGTQHPRETRYTCDDVVASIRDQGQGPVLTIGTRHAPRSGRDGAGDHFAVAEGETVLDYVVPEDPCEDALVWATSAGASRQLHDRCTARGGHTDLLTRWLAGQSVVDIGRQLGLEPGQARRRLQRAINWMRRRTLDGDNLRPPHQVPTVATR